MSAEPGRKSCAPRLRSLGVGSATRPSCTSRRRTVQSVRHGRPDYAASDAVEPVLTPSRIRRAGDATRHGANLNANCGPKSLQRDSPTTGHSAVCGQTSCKFTPLSRAPAAVKGSGRHMPWHLPERGAIYLVSSHRPSACRSRPARGQALVAGSRWHAACPGSGCRRPRRGLRRGAQDRRPLVIDRHPPGWRR
jgi:hypothetical protein